MVLFLINGSQVLYFPFIKQLHFCCLFATFRTFLVESREEQLLLKVSAEFGSCSTLLNLMNVAVKTSQATPKVDNDYLGKAKVNFAMKTEQLLQHLTPKEVRTRVPAAFSSGLIPAVLCGRSLVCSVPWHCWPCRYKSGGELPSQISDEESVYFWWSEQALSSAVTAWVRKAEGSVSSGAALPLCWELARH